MSLGCGICSTVTLFQACVYLKHIYIKSGNLNSPENIPGTSGVHIAPKSNKYAKRCREFLNIPWVSPRSPFPFAWTYAKCKRTKYSMGIPGPPFARILSIYITFKDLQRFLCVVCARSQHLSTHLNTILFCDTITGSAAGTVTAPSVNQKIKEISG